MMSSIDPNSVRLMPGKVLVQIVEVLGGTSKGGVFVPGNPHAGKDTFYGLVMKKGPAPALRHKKVDGRYTAEMVEADAAWPAEYDQQFGEGDVVVFPRDVPVAWSWEDRRYAICLAHEAIVAVKVSDFDAQGFEIVPWVPPQVENLIS